jgi:hypothetical protein
MHLSSPGRHRAVPSFKPVKAEEEDLWSKIVGEALWVEPDRYGPAAEPLASFYSWAALKREIRQWRPDFVL